MNTMLGSLGFREFSTTMGAVVDNPDWRRLGEHVTRRREHELGMTQADVHAAGGPSPASQRKIERGELPEATARTLGSLERALRWPAGTINRILAGGEPDGAAPTPPPAVLSDADRLMDYEIKLLEIRDDPQLSSGLRTWAGHLLSQITDLYAAADEEQRRAS
jgi:hypothetical protein